MSSFIKLSAIGFRSTQGSLVISVMTTVLVAGIQFSDKKQLGGERVLAHKSRVQFVIAGKLEWQAET